MSAEVTPTITVIMPAYNCEQYIHEAITSVLDQSFNNFKLIVLDDSSTDNTWSEICKFNDKRLIKIKNDINLGNLKCINRLFSCCETKFIAFQDADDWSHKDRLKIQLQFLDDNPNISFCGSNSIKSYDDKQVVKIYPNNDLKIRAQLSKGRTSLFCGSSILFKKEILKTVGNYNSLFDRIGSADIDWHLRILHLYKGGNIPQPLYYYRQHESSFTNIQENKNYLKYHSTDIALFLSLLRTKNDAFMEINDMKQFLLSYFNKTTLNTNQRMLELALKKNIASLKVLHKKQLASEKYSLGSNFIFYISVGYIIVNSIIPDKLLQLIISRRRLHKANRLLSAYQDSVGGH